MGDLAGRSFLVTGANVGIGLITARELARRGGQVTLACRSEAKTRPVIDAIVRETGNDEVDFLPLDLADQASVRAAARGFLARDRPLHVLVNNAGLAAQRGQTAQGFELAFGVNHLGHFLLTSLLLARLEASAPARIVNVASASHYRAGGIDFAALRQSTPSFTGKGEYEVSKLCNVLYTAELARRLAGRGVTAYSLHPGVIATKIWRRIPWPIRPLVNAFMKSPEEGAATTLYCATAPEIAGDSGLYYTDCKPKRPSRVAQDAELARKLWEQSEAWTAEA